MFSSLPPSAFCTLFPGAAVCVCTHTSRTCLGPRVVGFSFIGSHCSSYVFVCLLFKLGTTDLSSICTPSSPWRTFQHAGRKAPVQLKATPSLFLGDLGWFASNWLQPVWFSPGGSSGLVLTRWRAWHLPTVCASVPKGWISSSQRW